MGHYKKHLILTYLESRGWVHDYDGRLFAYLKPKNPNKFGSDFRLEIPLEEDQGFDNYIELYLPFLEEIVGGLNTVDDFRVLFARNHAVARFRYYDSDNADGMMQLDKYLDSLECFKRSLTKAVTFVATRKHIYANAKPEVDNFLKRCRSMQTEKGSYVSKFDLPNDDTESALWSFKPSEVNTKLFDVLSFVEHNIINAKKAEDITERYLVRNERFINFELLSSIYDMYSKTKINNIEYQLATPTKARTVVTEKVQPRLGYFKLYLKQVRDLLLTTIAIEVRGHVNMLHSYNPTADNNEIHISGELDNRIQKVKVIVNSHQYAYAMEAHMNGRRIQVKGTAVAGQKSIVLRDLVDFQIL